MFFFKVATGLILLDGLFAALFPLRVTYPGRRPRLAGQLARDPRFRRAVLYKMTYSCLAAGAAIMVGHWGILVFLEVLGFAFCAWRLTWILEKLA